MGWGGVGKAAPVKGLEGTQGPILNMAAKNVGVQAGHHPKGFLEGEEGGGEGGREKRRGEGCALKPFSGTRVGSSMSREELGVLELRSWGSSWREASSPGRLHEGQGVSKGWRWAAPDGSRCEGEGP